MATTVGADSAGVGNWHIGDPPDIRAQEAALRRGVDLSGLRARQISTEDFHTFDYVLAMDRENMAALETTRPTDAPAALEMFLTFAAGVDLLDVPDPYYGGGDGFEHVLDLVEQGVEGLLDTIVAARLCV